MPHDVSTFAEAKQRLEDLFGQNLPNLDDYAKVLHFLSDSASFQNALGTLSGLLWDEYRAQEKLRRNKFNISLQEVAVNYGFQYHPHVILTVGVDNFLDYLLQGVLIKDDMDLKHGEYSHTLQWLAVGAANLGLSKTVGDLYRGLGNSKLMSKKKTFKIDKAVEQHLWSYLADCFPTSMADSKQNATAAYSMHSDTYRTPQMVTKYLLNLNDPTHFLSCYLQWRYRKRSWITHIETKWDSATNSRVPTKQKYDAVSGGATVKAHAEQKHHKNPHYEAILKGQDKSVDVGKVRTGDVVEGYVKKTGGEHRKYSEAEFDKERVEVTFHGKKGVIWGWSGAN